MSNGSTHRRRVLQINRRYLSDDVHRRAAIRAAKSGTNAPLPLAQPEIEVAKLVGAEPAAPVQPAMVQAQKGEGQDKVNDQPGTRPNPQQIADRVYQLMCQDLRLERERKGW